MAIGKAGFLKSLGAAPQAPPDMGGMGGFDELGAAQEDATLDPAQARLDLEENVDPTTQDGETIFLDPEMFPNPPKKGQEITLKCQVKSVGSKISLTPLEIEGIDSEAEMGEGDEE